jgi:hypothetical protein
MYDSDYTSPVALLRTDTIERSAISLFSYSG